MYRHVPVVRTVYEVLPEHEPIHLFIKLDLTRPSDWSERIWMFVWNCCTRSLPWVDDRMFLFLKMTLGWEWSEVRSYGHIGVHSDTRRRPFTNTWTDKPEKWSVHLVYKHCRFMIPNAATMIRTLIGFSVGGTCILPDLREVTGYELSPIHQGDPLDMGERQGGESKSQSWQGCFDVRGRQYRGGAGGAVSCPVSCPAGWQPLQEASGTVQGDHILLPCSLTSCGDEHTHPHAEHPAIACSSASGGQPTSPTTSWVCSHNARVGPGYPGTSDAGCWVACSSGWGTVHPSGREDEDTKDRVISGLVFF